MPAGQSDSLAGVVLTIVVVFVILLLGVAIINPVVEQTQDSTSDGDRIQTNVITNDGADTWYRINRYSGTDPTVVTSRGYAVNLTGAPDSYVQSDANVDVAADDTWTVSAWARVDGDATAETMTALSVDGRLLVQYNRTGAEWVAWFYDDGSGDSYELRTAGPDQPANYTNIQVRSNGTHLELYRNNTLGDSVAYGGGTVTDAPVNTTDWNGRLEEVRTFDDALNASDRQALVDEPVAPAVGTNRTARVMFDEPYASQQVILFSPANLDTSNVTFSQGFAGEELQRGSMALLGDEYEWNDAGPRIRLLSGSDAENLPIVYVDYTLERLSPTSWVDPVTTVLGLAALVPILLLVGYVLTTLRRRR